jgi:hypothetical protein
LLDRSIKSNMAFFECSILISAGNNISCCFGHSVFDLFFCLFRYSSLLRDRALVHRKCFLRTLLHSYRIGKSQLVLSQPSHRALRSQFLAQFTSSHCMLHNILFIAMRWVMLVNSTTLPRTLLDPHLHERFHVALGDTVIALCSANPHN